jgi:hypothetical protein
MLKPVFTVLALCAPATAAAAADTFSAPATAVSVSGSVEVRVGERTHVLERFSQVPASATVITGHDGLAALRLASGSLVRLGPDTEILLRRLDQGTPAGRRKETVSVRTGKVWAAVLKLLGQDASFEVDTGNAVAGVRGTALFASVEGGVASYVVEHGNVEVLLNGGGSVRLDGPGAAVNVGGGRLGPASRLGLRELRALRHDVGGARAALGGGSPTPQMLSAAPPPPAHDQVRRDLNAPANTADSAITSPAALPPPTTTTSIIIEVHPPTPPAPATPRP